MTKRLAKLRVRWRRSGLALRMFVFAIGAALLLLLLYWQRPTEDAPNLSNNLLVFILVNLNIVFLCILAFLIGRNIVKLIFDRRRNILGSKLKLRLVVAFVGLTLIPIVFLFILASGLLNQAMEGWFTSQVETAVTASVDIARQHYHAMREVVTESSRRLAREISARGLVDIDTESLRSFLEKRRKEEALFSVRLIPVDGSPSVEVHSAASVIENFSEPELDEVAVRRSRRGIESVVSATQGASQFIRAYEAIPYFESGNDRTLVPTYILVTTYRINPELSQAMNTVNDSFREYEQLKLFKSPLRSGYVLILALITGLILFSAIWIGFYLAREIAVPIQRLAEGTRAVARGNYDFQIRAGGDDEIGYLVNSFNRMTADLKSSRGEAERRGLLIETILSNLAVAVIGLDSQRRVTSLNEPAIQILGIKNPNQIIGKDIHEILDSAVIDQVRPILEAAEKPASDSDSPELLERELQISSEGRERLVVCTAGRIVGEQAEQLGLVLLFDDITELSKAQHMSAWREVARRIAHEIKNPLTPIQLSAQRLLRLVGEGQLADPIRESAQTIVENVDSIKRLANEFSNFARMPAAEFRNSNLNSLIADTISPYAESHPKILFQFIADGKLPEAQVDPEQVRRVVINLVDNAIAALEKQAPGHETPRIVLKTDYDRKARMVKIEVADNGPGIKPADKIRIFEPYFTTKAGGTGLGLAIVTSIVADHQGEIRVFDNQPLGAKFVVEIPLTPRATTQRRLAQT